ncbi:MAG: methyltransferase domain-containing protein [Chloroflexi bacterium]|nr:MAG: methyltransferase domain-containing protein [Chloroflexota bacterium]
MIGQAENATDLAVSYDEVPYDGLTHSETHPSLLATVGALMGMDPAPIDRCRVLEIGCAQGYNLLAMAVNLPESEFIGIDFAPAQIAEGQKAITDLALSNVSLHALDLMALDDSLGQFDYIIAHGFYSWVPQPVRDQLLAVYRRLLTPNGIGYISYNAYPGGHFMNALRDGMLFHVGRIPQLKERASEARRWIDLLAETGETRTVPYSGFYKAYRQLIHDYQEHLGDEAGRSNAGLLHDELEEINRPFYLREFVENCEAAGLQYLGDTEFASMLATNVPANVAQVIQKSARSRVEAEQYLDFVRNRMFRRSLVCHQAVALSGKPSLGTVESFYISSNARDEEVERPSGSRPARKYIARDGSSLTTDHPVTIAAFDYLSEIWPRRMLFADLLQEAIGRTGQAASLTKTRKGSPDQTASPTQRQDGQVLAANLLKAYSISPVLMELHRYAPPLATTLSQRPVASRWARWQVRQNSRSICNLLHKRVLLDEPDCFLLLRLDGSRTVDDLARELVGGPLGEGHWHLKQEDGSPTGKVPAVAQVEKIVRDRVEWFALAALLEG